MEVELTLPDGRKWMRLTKRADAEIASELSDTLVGAVFHGEFGRRKAIDGSPAAAFFILLSADENQADVAARVAFNGKFSIGGMGTDGSLVTGRRNADPYPEFADAIGALSEHIGVALPPEAHPYVIRRSPDGFTYLSSKPTPSSEEPKTIPPAP